MDPAFCSLLSGHRYCVGLHKKIPTDMHTLILLFVKYSILRTHIAEHVFFVFNCQTLLNKTTHCDSFILYMHLYMYIFTRVYEKTIPSFLFAVFEYYYVYCYCFGNLLLSLFIYIKLLVSIIAIDYCNYYNKYELENSF